MKKIVLLISALTIIVGSSCKSKEKASKDDSSSTSSKNMQKEQKYRFIVSFFSIGTGIDGDAFKKMEDFAKAHSNKPAYESFSWGKEGEMDVAFSLKEFKKEADKVKFIEALKIAIGKSDRVRYKENEIASQRPARKVE